MLRRLFFLFPKTENARQAVEDLATCGIGRRQIHAIASGVDLAGLPEATERQKSDAAFRLEWFIWNTNLAVFVAAIAALITSLLLGQGQVALLSLLVMILTFIAGEQFAVRVPDVHLTEFTDALQHGEVLLMVDVPGYRVTEIENIIHHRHPESVPGGVSWTMGAFGL
jgi:hypothetical protein